MRKKTTFRISIRLPPTLDPNVAQKAVQDFFDGKEVDGYKFKVSNCQLGEGFNAMKLDEDSVKILN